MLKQVLNTRHQFLLLFKLNIFVIKIIIHETQECLLPTQCCIPGKTENKACPLSLLPSILSLLSSSSCPSLFSPFPFSQSSVKMAVKQRFAETIKVHNLHLKFTMKIYAPAISKKLRNLIFSGDICTP